MKRIVATIVLAVSLLVYGASPACAQTVERTPTGFYWPTGASDLGDYAGWLSDGCAWSGHDAYLAGQYHLAVDIAAREGARVYAIDHGTVLRLSPSGWGAGNVGVLVEHQLADGVSYIALYGHVRSTVKVGDKVAGGEAFATIGQYSPPHLHFGVRPGTSIASPYGGMLCPASPPITDTNGFVDPLAWITTRYPAGSQQPTATPTTGSGGNEPAPPTATVPPVATVVPTRPTPPPATVAPTRSVQPTQPTIAAPTPSAPPAATAGTTRPARPSPTPNPHLEREGQFIQWLQNLCANLGLALLPPLAACAVFGRRRQCT